MNHMKTPSGAQKCGAFHQEPAQKFLQQFKYGFSLFLLAVERERSKEQARQKAKECRLALTRGRRRKTRIVRPQRSKTCSSLSQRSYHYHYVMDQGHCRLNLCKINPGSCFSRVLGKQASKPDHPTELLSMSEDLLLLFWVSALLLYYSCPFDLKSFGAGTPELCFCAGCVAMADTLSSASLFPLGTAAVRQDGHRHRGRPAKIMGKNYSDQLL